MVSCKIKKLKTPKFSAFAGYHAEWRGFFFGGNIRICIIPGCENKYEAKGYCRRHYRKYMKYGDPLHTEIEKHGMCGTPEYKTWQQMKERCYNKKHAFYYRYGGRGIIICDHWKNSFISFYADMGPRPFPEAEIDRIDNDKDYFKENCHWTTYIINMRNASSAKLTFEKAEEIRKLYMESGVSQEKLARIYGVNRSNISHVVNNKTWQT